MTDLEPGDEILVNTATWNWQRDPAVAALTGGGYVVTWTSDATYGPDDHDGSGSGVYMQLYNADGTARGIETRVNTTIAGNQFLSDAVGLADGGFVVVWAGPNPNDNNFIDVYLQRYDASGNLVGGETVVDASLPYGQLYPAAGALSDGGCVVVWEGVDYETSRPLVFSQAYN